MSFTEMFMHCFRAKKVSFFSRISTQIDVFFVILCSSSREDLG
jgi:hypothetical protein